MATQETTNNLEMLMLRRVASVKEVTIADALGYDKSTISRIFSNSAGIRIQDLEAFLNCLGIKAFECQGEIVSISKEELNALKVLAKKGCDL